MRRVASGLTVVAPLLLAGCTQANDFTEKNIIAAIDKKLADEPLCKRLQRMKDAELRAFRQTLSAEMLAEVDSALEQGAIPIEGMASIAIADEATKKLENMVFFGLAESGFLAGETVLRYQTGGWFAATYSVIIMRPTVRPFLKESEDSITKQPKLEVCYAHAKVKRLVRWAKPTSEGNQGLAFFNVTYALDAPFAASAHFQDVLKLHPKIQKDEGMDIEASLIAMNDGLMVEELKQEE